MVGAVTKQLLSGVKLQEKFSNTTDDEYPWTREILTIWWSNSDCESELNVPSVRSSTSYILKCSDKLTLFLGIECMKLDNTERFGGKQIGNFGKVYWSNSLNVKWSLLSQENPLWFRQLFNVPSSGYFVRLVLIKYINWPHNRESPANYENILTSKFFDINMCEVW